MIVAIDGPSGAGKSSLARGVAERLGFRYLKTGVLYRAVALAALRQAVPLDDGGRLGDLASEVGIAAEGERVSLEGEDVTALLDDEEISKAASEVARHPQVRRALLGLQRAFAAEGDAVVEGRDMGTVVFPKAEVKVWLTADSRERARRRAAQKGGRVGEQLARLQKRDEADRSRPVAPLSKARDAIEIDTTKMSLEEVVARVVELVEEREKTAKASRGRP